MRIFKGFPFFKQRDSMDCGPACLKMIARHHGKHFSLPYLREACHISREGVSLLGIVKAAETIGMRATPVKIGFEKIEEEEPSFFDLPLPCIIHWDQYHFVIAYKVNKKYVWVADPAEGKFKMRHAKFKQFWLTDMGKGIALILETSPDFYSQEEIKVNKTGFTYLYNYLFPYKKLILQLVVGLFLGSLFQLTLPFLTQSIVDIGIQNQNIGFIYLVLLGQLMIFLGQMAVNVLQSWILLHIGTRINVALISDFLVKLMKLPIGFFDAKMIGDILQRINDHKRIETFLTTSTLSTLFSIFNFIVFGIVLLLYNIPIFLIFIFSSFIYIFWIVIFLKKRKEIDYTLFQESAKNQNNLIELVHGMQEIKLQNSENKRRRKWTNIQAKLFNASIRSLAITQYQDTGAFSINQIKDIFISFIAATAVVKGEMTLGMMLAIQYIVGQLNAPLLQFIQFVRSSQDAKISLERLGEILQKDNEENLEYQIDLIPEKKDLVLEKISFKYNQLSEEVLSGINLLIPEGKVTAIVGTSGSGKTTLIKLLLGFYPPTTGKIKIGNMPLEGIGKSYWRKQCGAVMQDGYIFSDSIANNIAESDELIDKNKLLNAVQVANIQGFVESLPLSYNTIIGSKGNGISQGQKQRLLIARAVYKNPNFLFFDEATNALDAKNERIIVENLSEFFQNKTVIVVAHRLSTVKNADQIVVLDKGKIIEVGVHNDLVEKKGAYFDLVKNQLELGN